jgi:outer membrane protein TolC
MLLIEARNQHAVVSAELARLIGLDLLQSIEPAETLDAPITAATSATLVAEARSSRAERQALELRVEAGELQQTAVARSLWPLVSVTGGLDYARPNPRIFPRADRWDDSWQAGITVSWSLWDGGRARAESIQAAALTDVARRRLDELDSMIGLEVRQRLLELDSGRAALAATADAIAAAAEARRVVAERYQVGVATQTELLDADVALLQAELDRTRALAGLRLADARLARALGR